MSMEKIRTNPGQDKYPDLKEPILEHRISVVHTAMVSQGLVTITDTVDGHNVTISEWDFGNFVESWLMARLGERFPQKKEES